MIMVDRKVSSGKDGIAIHFKVGDAAKNAAAELSTLALEMVDIIGCKSSDAPKAISNMKAQAEMDAKMLKNAVKTIASSLSPEMIGDVELYSAILPGSDRSTISEAAESIKSKGGIAAFVIESGTLSVMLASGVSGLDCKKTLADVLASFGGKGGGKNDFAQGGVQGAKAEDVLKALVDGVKNNLG
jgi:alanyl-tRNA synthetase